MDKQQQIDDLMQKVADSKRSKLDLSADEDLSIAIMNLISIEEHFYFTGMKTGKGEYFDLLNVAREMRKELLKKIIKEYEGEVWCISKHLLAASMRLMEVGTKQLGQGKKAEAQDLFAKAYDLYALFWGINLKLIDIGEVKKIGDDQLNKDDKSGNEITNLASTTSAVNNVQEKSRSMLGRLGELVKKTIDCCLE